MLRQTVPSSNYQKVIRYGDESLKSELMAYAEEVRTRVLKARKQVELTQYKVIIERLKQADKTTDYDELLYELRRFQKAGSFENTETQAEINHYIELIQRQKEVMELGIKPLLKEREKLRLDLVELTGLFDGKRKKEVYSRLKQISDKLHEYGYDDL